MIRRKNGSKYTYSIGGYRKSNDLEIFRKKIDIIAAASKSKVEDAKKEIQSWLDEGFFLQAKCLHLFHVEQLFFKNGNVKRLDADNRIKAALDAVGIILQIDDKLFFKSETEKVLIQTKGLEQCTEIQIRPYKMSRV